MKHSADSLAVHSQYISLLGQHSKHWCYWSIVNMCVKVSDMISVELLCQNMLIACSFKLTWVHMQDKKNRKRGETACTKHVLY